MKKEKLTENKAEATPTGGVLVGKRQGQTMIHNKGSLSGYLVGRTHAEGGIKAVNKSTGQPLEMQGGEVVITAPAVSDNTKREFEGKMMTNREILSTINEKGGGVSFAKDGMEIPKSIKHTGASYKYGGKTMTDQEIMTSMNSGGHLADGFSLRDIADIHQVPLTELKKQVRLGMKAESEHTSSKREQMKIVKDHLFENPKYYTLLEKAGLKNGGRVHRGSLVRDAKDGNSPARDLNNYNDLLDVQTDGAVGGDSGIYADGGSVGVEINNSALKDVESTTRALENLSKIGVEINIPYKGKFADGKEFFINLIKPIEYTDFSGTKRSGFKGLANSIVPYEVVAEAYHKAKVDGSNPELVKAIENIFKTSNPDIRYVDGGELNTEPFLNYYFEELKDFLKNQNDIKLKDDYTFIYNRGELFTIEPLIKSDKDLDEKIKSVNFVIFDSENENVGEIYFDPNNKKKFNAYSEFFEWNNIKFYDGGNTTFDNSNPDIRYDDGGEVIRQLGNGSNVYFETEEHRLNDFNYGNKGKYVLNVGYKDADFGENIYFDDLKEALSIAEKIERDFPNGVPTAILLDKVIENYKKESIVEPMNKEVNKKQKSFESEGSTEGKGKLYEFFTPQVVADKMLALAQHYGFKGGNVLEPATGSGRLIKNLKDTNITAFEISKENFEILKREFPNAELYNYNFEKAFLKEPRFNTLLNRKGTETWLKNAPFDLVVANPPYGKFSGLYSSYFNFKGQVEHFFILQTLYLLKKGGLGVYLIPSSFLRNGIAYNDIKKQIFEIAEFVDAYRLPSNIFEKTQIGTDILILRKK